MRTGATLPRSASRSVGGVEMVDGVLDEAVWTARAEAHAQRVDAYVGPHLARRDAGVKHPVRDFLFGYYSQRPAQLRRWHPGYGVRLAGGAGSHGGLKGYEVVGREGRTRR